MLQAFTVGTNHFRVEKDILRNKEYYRDILNKDLKKKTVFHVMLESKKFDLFAKISDLVDYNKVDSTNNNVLGFSVSKGFGNIVEMLIKDIETRQIPFSQWSGVKVYTKIGIYDKIGYKCKSTLLAFLKRGDVNILELFKHVNDNDMSLQDSLMMLDILIVSSFSVGKLLLLSHEIAKKYDDINDIPNHFLRLIHCLEGVSTLEHLWMRIGKELPMDKYASLVAKLEKILINKDFKDVVFKINKSVKI